MHRNILIEGLLQHKFFHLRIVKKMTTTISTITIESAGIPWNELSEKEKFAKRFKPRNLKRNNPSRKQTSKHVSIVRPLQADDIKEHRIRALLSTIFCFFLIGPCIALYHSRRIRKMKENGELARAQAWSERVWNFLVISNIIGIIVWIGILFVVIVPCAIYLIN